MLERKRFEEDKTMLYIYKICRYKKVSDWTEKRNVTNDDGRKKL